jgi:hypothetical protein
MWGNCNWGHGDVDIDVNKYNNFNQTNTSNKNWEHNPEHRKGAEYRDQGSRDKYGRDAKGVESREQFRGRAESGQKDLARNKDQVKRDLERQGGADRTRDKAGGDRPSAGQRDRAGAGADRPSAGQRDRAGAGADRPSASTRDRSASQPRAQGQRREAGAYEGMGNGRDVQRASSRGQSSRSAASRGGGGGARGGGGGGRRGR